MDGSHSNTQKFQLDSKRKEYLNHPLGLTLSTPGLVFPIDKTEGTLYLTCLVIDSEHICDVNSNVYNVHTILDWKLKLIVIGEKAEISVHHPAQLLSTDQLTLTPTVRV